MIHQYQNNGYSIVLDVNSGAVHVVDELCYDAIAQLAAGEEPDLPWKGQRRWRDSRPHSETDMSPGRSGRPGRTLRS